MHVALASLALKRGDEVKASEHYRLAIALQPAVTSVANDFAWLLATARDPGVRDAKTAVEVAEQLVQREENSNYFDTLAAAYAAGGRFEDAVRTASRAAELAERERGAARLADIRRNLDRYRARQTAAR